VLKDARSPERLLDETALFLHRAVATWRGQRRIERKRERRGARRADRARRGRRRPQIFALSSLLERHGMRVASAATGGEAIEMLNRAPEVSLARWTS